MATMVKEKRREKKKSKEKSSANRELSPVTIQPPVLEEFEHIAESASANESFENVQATESDANVPQVTEEAETSNISIEIVEDTGQHVEETTKEQIVTQFTVVSQESITSITQSSSKVEHSVHIREAPQTKEISQESTAQGVSLPLNREGSYKELSRKLERMVIPREQAETITEAREDELVNPNAYLSPEAVVKEAPFEYVGEDVMPSAPCFDEVPETAPYEEVVIENRPKVKCMPLEDAIKLCAGREMEEVRAMSEREEELVEAGPLSGPEHPLVDLLSTFRSSLIAVERERLALARGFTEEEKRRSTLWKIEKRHVNLSEQCACGLNVDLRASYEHAEMVKERLPIAKLKLESLLRDVQDSYCHHQHAALLAHCQIEELISETVQSNKNVIREALALVLQALRLSDNAPESLASALQRWAAALSAALLDNRDLRQLLFLMHQLFRQSRSVQWASLVVHASVDAASPWRLLALLELLLARTRPDAAQECVEECSEVWEELDAQGGGGAVSDGTLRERDLLALFTAFPLRDLCARIVLFTHSDIRHARAHEWGDNSRGRGVLKASCGTRALLHALLRARLAHATYARLHKVLRELAARVMHALACLHLISRSSYIRELEDQITAELEAVFSAGVTLFDAQELDKLPATLLADNTAKDYCISIILGFHDKSPKQLELLSLELPVLPCETRIRIVSQAAIDRADDHELARIVLEFLLQTGLKRKSVSCKGQCDVAARECVPRLLAAHAYLHVIALHIVADLNIVETLDPSCVKTLNVHKWHPNSMEILSLLEDWSRRCQVLLQHLLLELDYTPHVGLPLEVQLSIGAWLCTYVHPLPTPPEWCWSVLRRLRVHRTCWGMSLDAPPPGEQPGDLFSIAFAILSSSWGHCIPVICSEGVSGLVKLAAARPRDAVQCLSGVMLVMAHSPESVAFTPKFNEVFSTLLNSGPSLMQRALGRGGEAGADLLLRLLLAQCANVSGSALCAWLAALWRTRLPGACALADAAAVATRLWPHLDAYANSLLQEENAKEHIDHAVRNAASAPLLCECLLRAWHAAREARSALYARLLSALHQQRAQAHKIHVDNALQKIGASMAAEELVIYRTANAALVAPVAHPSHLTLWRLLMHLYLQTPPEYGPVPAIGPLFFSGMKKSRTLSQIKKRLLDTITYHHNEGETLKNEHKSIDTGETQSIQRAERASPADTDDSLLPALSIIDLTGESSGSSDSDDDADDSRSDKEASPNREAIEAKRNIFSLITYHAAAEKMLNEYLSWLEEGEKVRAPPHFADIARYIPEHALEAAWKRAVPRPLPSIEVESFPLPSVPPPPDNSPPQTPFHIAVDNILKIKDHSRRRRKRTLIKSPLEDVDFRDARTLLSLVDKHLKDIERLAHDWCTEVSRVSALDSKLWELVSVLRVRRALPPVRKSCANKCKPITIYIPEQEWCISVDAERGIKENRHSARVSLRRLARARPHAAKTAAALHTIARRTCSSEAGVRVVERAWRCAGAPATGACAPAATLLTALTTDLAERWICHDGRLSADLLSTWGKRASTALQQTLCGSLLAPRRLAPGDWHKVYTALLASSLPSHAVFSYLSKFEMTRWSETAEATQRRDMLEALIHAVQRWGPSPAPEHTMLVELLGVHSAVLVDSRELCAHIVRCVTAAINNKLPPAHWTHVVRAVEIKAAGVPFDQLGHVIRSVGVSWWEARTGMSGARGTSHAAHAPHVARLLHALQRAAVAAARALSYEPERGMYWACMVGGAHGHGARGTSHAAHAPHVARLLHALQRAAVAAARALSYEPERVAWYAWATLQESWGPWISPHPAAPPLLPSTGDHEQYTPMLRHFVDNVHQVMLDCPGTEVPLLQQIFEWSVQTYLSVQGSVSAPSLAGTAAQESRVQASAMLAELAKLPWSEHQWFYGKCLQQALQMSTSTDRELTTWCCNTWRGTLADTLLRGCDATQISPRLAELLYLFTGTMLPHSQQILDEACKLPWTRLPEPALDEALDRFFMLHHNPAVPYHDLPQFRLILVACSLLVTDPSAVRSTGTCRAARARGVSQWVRGACAPTLAAHVPAHTVHVLGAVTELGMLCVTSAVRSTGTCRAARARGVSQWVRGACAPTLAAHVPAHTVHVLGAVTELGMLCVTSAVRSTGTCRAARARGVSQWVRGACAPTLAAHVPAHTVHVLGAVTELAVYLDETQGEIEELLSRAVVIMCIEPAAAAALPVWVTWVTDGPTRLVRACVSAVAALTVFEYFATLAEAAVKALLLCNEPYGWREVSHRWASCPWREAHTLAQRGRVHAAYACALTHAHTAAAVRATLAAVLSADIHLYPDNEPIIAVWICYACRMAVTHTAQPEQSDAMREYSAAARALLARWAEQPRRSILRVVTMHADHDRPTALHRILCRYALCVLTPEESTRRVYESACASTLGANNDVTSWAETPQLNKLVRLACRLWPKYEKYFQCELEMASNVVSA
ncbi:uncharacterized protein LOC110380037 [Helicoverpa armigera]|uniref:uncharacterized protein LOC110380037 n=1 Tax=Helicoverpa armigera TaxID=29058 RepID=UPI0030828B98